MNLGEIQRKFDNFMWGKFKWNEKSWMKFSEKYLEKITMKISRNHIFIFSLARIGGSAKI